MDRLPRAKDLTPPAASLWILAAVCCFSLNTRPAFAGPQPPLPSKVTEAAKPQAYAGDAACQSCHEKESLPYLETAHHLTSSLPTADTIEGSFDRPFNLMRTANPNLGFMMTASSDGYFQTAVDISDPEHGRTLTEPFDIVVGSGRKAHTYLFWKEDQLFELPVSYWKETREWINSPGYPDGYVHFDKAVVPRCLDCHASYFESLAPPLNRFRRNSLVLGISCEKCHGPGREHVAQERSASSPRASPAGAIVNPYHLPR